MTRTTNRAVLRLTGADRTEFLQGLITNDIKGLSDVDTTREISC